MNVGIKDLLVNLLFFLIPLFIIQIFWVDNQLQKKWEKPLAALIGSLSIILCMTFPNTFSPGFIFDLRQIPLILGFLYLGRRIGIWLIVSLLAYRMYLGGEGFYVSLIVVTFIFLIASFLSKRYMTFSAGNKMIITIGLSLLAGLTNIIITHLFVHSIALKYLPLNYLVIQTLGMWLSTYFIETMLKNKIIEEEIFLAEKMNIISQIAASISHEVRNPLTVIKGFLQLLHQDTSKEKMNMYLDLALEELERAQEIITDYLALAKPQVEEYELLNVKHEIERVVGVLTPYANMNQVVFNLDIRINSMIMGERQKFRQCLINLLKNSIEAMPEGGAIHIYVSSRAGQPIIDIRDTGVGMTSEQIQNLGIPYYSSKKNGTGLGMLVVLNVIRSMQGTIKIESEKGVGTRFSLAFSKADIELQQSL